MNSICQQELKKMLTEPHILSSFMSTNNLLLTISGGIVASIGFMYNDYSVILGSMLISPLGNPILQSILSILLGSAEGIWNGLISFFVLTLVAISIGFGMNQMNKSLDNYYTVPTDKMEQLTSDKFLVTNFVIGCFTGFFIAYAKVYQNIGVLHGFSLVVAILPPLVNSGLYASLAYQNINDPELYQKYKKDSLNSFKIAYTNVAGLALSMLIGFMIFCKN